MRLPRTRRAALAAMGMGALAIGVTGLAASTFAARRDAAPADARAPVAQQLDWSECMDAQQRRQVLERAPHFNFVFTRGVYSSYRGWGRGRRGGSWATDWPKSDCQFNVVFRRLTNLDAYPGENAVTLDDPALRKYPFLYMLEVGRMALQPEEIKGLRDYALAGGFIMIDDFWGTYEWLNFEEQMRMVFPEFPIVDIPMDHALFNSFYQIDEVLQVPAINRARWGQTWEQDGYVPYVRGIFDDRGRLMVAINWNTDLGDAWEWAEQPDYPVKYSHYAFQVGVNHIIYAMSH